MKLLYRFRRTVNRAWKLCQVKLVESVISSLANCFVVPKPWLLTSFVHKAWRKSPLTSCSCHYWIVLEAWSFNEESLIPYSQRCLCYLNSTASSNGWELLNHTACGRVVYYKVVTKQALTITGYRASHKSAQNFFRPMLSHYRTLWLQSEDKSSSSS